MASYYPDGKTWTVAYDGRLDGKPRGRSYIYGLTEKAAKAAKERKDHQEQLRKAGLFVADPHAGRRAKGEAVPLPEHVTAFERSILARKKGARHAHHQAAHVTRLIGLSVGETADGATLRRLSFIGELEEGDVQARLKHLLDTGLAPRTVNAARQAVQQFGRWLKRKGFVSHNPVEDLARYDEQTDVRRKRRAMSQEEVDWLLDVTAKARDFVSRRCGIPPADREKLYATGIGTGFRQAALLSLTKQSFHVAPTLLRPFVRLGPAFNKNRKDRDQPIRRDLAAVLFEWLKTRPDKGPVWPAAPHADLALRFRRDMEHARAEWEKAARTAAERERRQQDPTFLRYCYHDGVRNVFADFHGLRHTGITFVVRHAGLKVGQAWADHSTPALTARYAHMDLVDEDKALEALPAVRKPQLQRAARKAR